MEILKSETETPSIAFSARKQALCDINGQKVVSEKDFDEWNVHHIFDFPTFGYHNKVLDRDAVAVYCPEYFSAENIWNRLYLKAFYMLKLVKDKAICFEFSMGKIKDYLFVKKVDLMKSMGYIIDDAEEVYNIIAESAKKEFLKGKYELGVLNRYGQRVSIAVELAGKRDKNGRVYRFISGWMAYPNGKLHNNTPFSGFVK